MPSTILSDNGVSSGSAGLKTTASNDGILALQTTTSGGTATTAVTINTSQNVGVGTSSPLTPLHVVGAINSQRTGVSQYTRMFNNAGTATFISDNQASGTYTGFDFQGLSTASGTPVTYVTIDGSGNLGVGTTTPDVFSRGYGRVLGVSSSSTNAAFEVNGATGTNSYIDMGINSTRAFGLQTDGTYGIVQTITSIPLLFSTNNTERARFDNSGVLLVNRTSYSSGITSACKFQVLGTGGDWSSVIENSNGTSPYGLVVKFSGASPNNTSYPFLYALDTTSVRFFVYSNGGIANYSGNNTNLSDRREKTNFAPAGDYLAKICAIPVQTFNYIDQNLEEDDGLTLGVVAQDVQEIAPELVTESNWGTEEEPKMRLSIYQTDLQYALMKSIQELKAIVDAQAAEIAALKGTQP